MKKFLFISLTAIFLVACKKTEFSPEGPTDVRVRNITADYTFNEVIVNTSGGIDTLGNIGPGQVSEYYRFDKAYYRAEISCKINGIPFSTGPVSYTYLTYIGQAKITYVVYIKDFNNRKLDIDDCILESGLDE